MNSQNVTTLNGSASNTAKLEFKSENTRTSLLANLAKSALAETAAIALLSKATGFYAVSLSTTTLLPHLAIGIIITNTLFKSVGYCLQYRQLGQQETTPKCPKSGLDRFKTIADWVAPLNFAFFFGTTGNLLIHEAGHISAASLVYRGLKAQVTIPGLFRGAVSWTKTGLTAFGSSLGGLNSRLLVCVAGPLAAVSIATGALVAGIHLRNRFPEFSKYVILASVVTLLYQVVYALSALWVSSADLCHDFVMLQHVGVNPIVASLCLASIPVIVLVAYFKLKKTRSEQNPCHTFAALAHNKEQKTATADKHKKP